MGLDGKGSTYQPGSGIMPERLGRNFCDPTILFKNCFMLFGTIFALNIL